MRTAEDDEEPAVVNLAPKPKPGTKSAASSSDANKSKKKGKDKDAEHDGDHGKAKPKKKPTPGLQLSAAAAARLAKPVASSSSGQSSGKKASSMASPKVLAVSALADDDGGPSDMGWPDMDFALAPPKAGKGQDPSPRTPVTPTLTLDDSPQPTGKSSLQFADDDGWDDQDFDDM